LRRESDSTSSRLPRQWLSLPLRSGGRCRRRKGAAVDLDPDLEAPKQNQERPLHPRRGSFPRFAGEATARVPSSSANGFPFPCEAGEGAEGGRGQLLILILILKLQSKIKSAPF